MNSDNITLKTSGNHEVILRPFITGRQKRYISGAFTEDVNLRNEGGETSFEMPATKADIAQDRAIESVVVSVDGKTEKVVDAVLDLPAADFDEVFAKINEITGDEKKEPATPKQ